MLGLSMFSFVSLGKTSGCIKKPNAFGNYSWILSVILVNFYLQTISVVLSADDPGRGDKMGLGGVCREVTVLE